VDVATQEKVLRSATACFGHAGYAKTSIDTIAERAGVAKGTVYLYCKSKQDLFYQAVHRELRAWVAELSKHIDPRRPADELMMEMGASDAAFVERRALVRDLLYGMYHGQIPAMAAQFEELRALGLQHVIELLELGIRQGRFAADLDVEATARVLQDLQISGSLLVHRTGLPLPEVRRRQIAAFRLVMDGLRSRDPAPLTKASK
jgi:TetR/AcrR family fatty acid metabolism transcriptional regulator